MEDATNFERIATAIDYIRENFKDQPDLNKVAKEVHLSPFHFQRLFTEWAGVSPKKFLQYLSLEYAKSMLQDKGTTLFDAAFETGLSGTGRLHDLFIGIEGMTPENIRMAEKPCPSITLLQKVPSARSSWLPLKKVFVTLHSPPTEIRHLQGCKPNFRMHTTGRQ